MQNIADLEINIVKPLEAISTNIHDEIKSIISNLQHTPTSNPKM